MNRIGAGRRRLLSVVCVVLASAASLPAAEVARYFDDAAPVRTPPASFYVRVTQVEAGLPADRAGIRLDDRIIGIDGLRVRNIPETTFLRHYYDRRTNLVLTLVRDGAITNIPVQSLFPVRRLGIQFTETAPALDAVLKAWTLSWQDVFGVAPPRLAADAGGLPKELLTAFAVEDPVPRILPFMRMECFPPRALEALLDPAQDHSPARRESVRHLLQAYACLLAGKYPAATSLIADPRLFEQDSDPFLRQLAGFYKALAERPVSREGIQVSRYGVDLAFFVMCYPYPLVPEVSGSGPVFDAEFQARFNKASSGLDLFSDDLNRDAHLYLAKERGTAEEYVGQVKASLLDLENQGGWPFRSYLIYDKAKRPVILNQLLARLDEQPDRILETAFAILAPAMIERNTAAFERAYAIVAASGGREAGFANDLIRLTERHWGLKTGRHREVMRRIGAERPQAAIYEYLASASPAFRRRAEAGAMLRNGTFVEDLGYACSHMPDIVARAIAEPVDVEEIVSQVETGALKSQAPNAEEALRALSYALGTDPQPAVLDALIRLRSMAGVGAVCEALACAFGYQAAFSPRQASTDIVNPCRDFLLAVEREHYRAVANALKTMDGTGPQFDRQIERWCRDAGIPSVWLLIARKLGEAGRTEEAQRYADKAVGFHYVLMQSCQRPPAFVACRDLASVPGMSAEFERYRLDLESRPGQGPDLLLAIMASYEGDADAAVGHMVASTKRSRRQTEDSWLYDGEVWVSAAALVERLVANLRTAGPLTGEQEARLKEAGLL